MDHELVLEPECRDLTRLHSSTRWRLEREGKFPRCFKIGDPDAQNGRKAVGPFGDHGLARGPYGHAVVPNKSAAPTPPIRTGQATMTRL